MRAVVSLVHTRPKHEDFLLSSTIIHPENDVSSCIPRMNIDVLAKTVKTVYQLGSSRQSECESDEPLNSFQDTVLMCPLHKPNQTLIV